MAQVPSSHLIHICTLSSVSGNSQRIQSRNTLHTSYATMTCCCVSLAPHSTQENTGGFTESNVSYPTYQNCVDEPSPPDAIGTKSGRASHLANMHRFLREYVSLVLTATVPSYRLSGSTPSNSSKVGIWLVG